MTDGEDAAPTLIEGRNGGTLTPWRKGQSGNPAGRTPKRELLAREYADRVGLRGLLELARQFDERKAEVIGALLDAACAQGNSFAPAQQLLWRLLGMADRKLEVEARGQLEVQVRKLRIVDEENAPPEARTIELRKNGHGKYEEGGPVDAGGEA